MWDMITLVSDSHTEVDKMDGFAKLCHYLSLANFSVQNTQLVASNFLPVMAAYSKWWIHI